MDVSLLPTTGLFSSFPQFIDGLVDLLQFFAAANSTATEEEFVVA